MSSSSCFRVRPETVTREFRVGRYLHLDGQVPPGQSINFGEIDASRRKWKLFYYPNGVAKKPGQVCIGLMLMEDYKKPFEVGARYSVSILDNDGKPMHSSTVEGSYFSGRNPRSFHGLATAEDQRSVLRRTEDGSLLVRCELTAPRVEQVPERFHHIKSFLQKFLE